VYWLEVSFEEWSLLPPSNADVFCLSQLGEYAAENPSWAYLQEVRGDLCARDDAS
jgi:hypothetical protein